MTTMTYPSEPELEQEDPLVHLGPRERAQRLRDDPDGSIAARTLQQQQKKKFDPEVFAKLSAAIPHRLSILPNKTKDPRQYKTAHRLFQDAAVMERRLFKKQQQLEQLERRRWEYDFALKAKTAAQETARVERAKQLKLRETYLKNTRQSSTPKDSTIVFAPAHLLSEKDRVLLETRGDSWKQSQEALKQFRANSKLAAKRSHDAWLKNQRHTEAAQKKQARLELERQWLAEQQAAKTRRDAEEAIRNQRIQAIKLHKQHMRTKHEQMKRTLIQKIVNLDDTEGETTLGFAYWQRTSDTSKQLLSKPKRPAGKRAKTQSLSARKLRNQQQQQQTRQPKAQTYRQIRPSHNKTRRIATSKKKKKKKPVAAKPVLMGGWETVAEHEAYLKQEQEQQQQQQQQEQQEPVIATVKEEEEEEEEEEESGLPEALVPVDTDVAETVELVTAEAAAAAAAGGGGGGVPAVIESPMSPISTGPSDAGYSAAEALYASAAEWITTVYTPRKQSPLLAATVDPIITVD